MASFSARRAGRGGTAFGVSGADADDFYDVVMSSEEEEEEEEEESNDNEDLPSGQSAAATALSGPVAAGQRPPLAPTTPLGMAMAGASASRSRAVLRPIGTMAQRGHPSHHQSPKHQEQELKNPTQQQQQQQRSAMHGMPVQPTKKEFALSAAQWASHSQRRSALETALDAALLSQGSSDTSGLQLTQAPFRFQSLQSTQEHAQVGSPAPAPAVASEGHGPELSEGAKKKKQQELITPHLPGTNADVTKTASDPLYGDELDDADEKWVHTNLRRPGATTDASLCCPCCFLTVCMDCERHVKFPNQYRARVAINCRVNKAETLSYSDRKEDTGGHLKAGALIKGRQRPQAKPKLQSQSSPVSERAATALTLREDEYFGVTCADCGTTVGVYDHEQYYHLFNVLPSTS